MIRKSLFSVCFVFIFSLLSGQDTTGIPSENVEVIKRYQASILQSTRKDIHFEKKESTKAPINYSYNVSGEKVIDFERPSPEIRPLGYEGEPVDQQKLKNGYLYGAYGTHKTVSAGAAYHYFIEDWLNAGFKVDHFSARDDSLTVFNATNSEADLAMDYALTDVEAYVGYSLSSQSSVRLSGQANLSQRRTSPSPWFSRMDSISNIPVNKFGGEILFDHNTFEDNGFAFRLGGGYHIARHKVDEQDDNRLDGRMNIFKNISPKLTAELPLNYVKSWGMLPENELIDKKTFNDFIIRPNFRYKGQNFLAKAGLEYITGDSVSYLFPIVDISLDRVVSIVNLRLYTESEYFRNSMYNLVEDSPYLVSNSADYSGSYFRSYNVQPSASYKDLDFALNFSFRTYDNEANYLGLYFSGRYLATYLDREEFQVKPSWSYKLSDDVVLGLSLEYNNFLSQDSLITNRPNWLTEFSGEQYLLDRKLKFTQNLKVLGKRKHLDAGADFGMEEIDASVQLPSFLDLAIGIRYTISDAFDVYVQGTNLLPTQGAELWRNYPIFERQVWAGLKLRI